MTEQLSPLLLNCEIASSRVHRLATIQHVRTPITGTLSDGQHVLDIVDALHPTPAVGGVPIDRAWKMIQETETFERGWYAAPIGWFDAEGDGEFTVGIRSGLVRDRDLTLFAGNGIVAESDPEDEWAEVALKVRPILDELE
ncbi:MAG: chorismate-binding protein [Natrialbaceae archaeon]|nr:chorismate-binding protein [Natrialbaceae archaeon]